MRNAIVKIENGRTVTVGGGDFVFPVGAFPNGDFPNGNSPTAEFNNCYILPGFVDVHVHLREPGFLYKETIETGAAAAAAGGFTCIFAMPNLSPCPDSPANLQVQLDAIDRAAKAAEADAKAIPKIIPYGAITEGQKGERMADLEALAAGTPAPAGVIAFTDDGFGVMSDELMEEAMRRAKALGRIIVAHCEDTNYPKDSSETEWKQLVRDIELVRKTGCSYHACHVSTKESVSLIRQAKKEGLDVTCETAPHYLLLTREDVERAKKTDKSPGRFKMNPPIKHEEDRQALLEGLKDGTIDMIATDHAPHSREEKEGSFEKCAYGIVGLETAFPVLYTKLVKTGEITLEKLVDLMSTAPAERFGWDCFCGGIAGGNFTVWDLEEEYEINPEEFRSKGKSTPFAGWKVQGRCRLTAVDGKEAYRHEKR